jgi:excisionase family DNA binding protein
MPGNPWGLSLIGGLSSGNMTVIAKPVIIGEVEAHAMNKIVPPEVLTLEEAAAFLRLPNDTVKRLALRGSLPGRKIGRHWRFSKSALEHWLSGYDGRAVLLQQAGAFADDDTLMPMLEDIYKKRGRAIVE